MNIGTTSICSNVSVKELFVTQGPLQVRYIFQLSENKTMDPCCSIKTISFAEAFLEPEAIWPCETHNERAARGGRGRTIPSSLRPSRTKSVSHRNDASAKESSR